ncbi:hypothetical protein TW95_gp0103 [Pandoravirus inopinatum]|uniref:Uncharacterized protein n=1 Tax=Pandoravirus inopinatum TaxID=1605721 RepID=A0A0B5JBA3_9VIRU|nr:hypothetical protein TW95_gp0103 [Pandoravirus inopinatum]AJF96837.1 hypothetical protein [Pandoravirus inopinatum]
MVSSRLEYLKSIEESKKNVEEGVQQRHTPALVVVVGCCLGEGLSLVCFFASRCSMSVFFRAFCSFDALLQGRKEDAGRKRRRPQPTVEIEEKQGQRRQKREQQKRHKPHRDRGCGQRCSRSGRGGGDGKKQEVVCSGANAVHRPPRAPFQPLPSPVADR